MAQRPITILLVEDNPADARLVQHHLDDVPGFHYELLTAQRLADALNSLDNRSVDAVLLDLSLPDAHGLDTVIRISQVHPAVPIVILSGHADEGLALQAVQQGAQDYLVKGHGDGQVIARVVRYAMERKRTEEALRQAREELEQRVAERTANLRAVNEQLQREIVQRLRTEDALRKEHDFISAVLDMVGSLVTVLDRDGRIIGFNRACETITGYSLAEVRGRTVWDIFIAPEEIAAVRGVFSRLRAGDFPNTHENYWITRDQRRRLIAWSNTVLLDENQAVEHVIATGVDVTELKRAADMERRHMLELAHVARLSTMGEMATEIAHELNQPLTAIANYSHACVHLLEGPHFDVADVTQAMRGVAGQAQRAGEIIRGLRSFVGKEAAHRSTTDINDVIRSVVALARVEARWHHVDVVLALQQPLPAVLADKTLLEQVVLNLVRNAIEAMETTDKTLRSLKIETSATAGTIEVGVSDTGPGLPEDKPERVFERFFTTKANGMGMGLAICRSIVEAHGGYLWAEPNSPHGARFRFTIPIARVPP